MCHSRCGNPPDVLLHAAVVINAVGERHHQLDVIDAGNYAIPLVKRFNLVQQRIKRL
jgi:hypothetical protein